MYIISCSFFGLKYLSLLLYRENVWPLAVLREIVSYYPLSEVDKDARSSKWAVLESSPELVGSASMMQVQQCIKIDESLMAKIYLKGKTNAICPFLTLRALMVIFSRRLPWPKG